MQTLNELGLGPRVVDLPPTIPVVEKLADPRANDAFGFLDERRWVMSPACGVDASLQRTDIHRDAIAGFALLDVDHLSMRTDASIPGRPST